jgi:septal ring factor EnvC (AmiA/AmiB activator)
MKKYAFKYGNPIKLISLCLLIIFSASACTTSGFLGIGDPVTTTSYVESTIAESDTRISDLEVTIQELNETIESMETDIELMESDINAVSNIKADLDEMPIEMLRQLVQALQSYLEMLEKE